ncbi:MULTISPECIES: hypothetical protein [unclassified Pseudactinotalea]|uniref:hypothetical protein n=1 Tax=unclassified Pseudactinotalea TaxID=2649176 RepID=UPI00128AF5C1|nr:MULTISPECIES: hypothetical protein [unclassified Pseudactinotalea]MPV50430.1 hypothetical protein [Pseudactinotalea sp. HY160]QGH70542.1 hypothetical protein GCE65_14350 [Pseudactinotalea sp. HY158]
MSGSFRAVVAATAATGVGVTTLTPRPLLTITVAAIAVICALGWPALVGLPARAAATVVLLATAASSVLVVELLQDLAWLAVVAAGAVLAAFLAQLFRRDGRPRLLEEVAGTITGAVIVASAAGWLAIGPSPRSEALVITAAVAIAVASVVALVRLPATWSTVASVVLACAAGSGIGFAATTLSTLVGALVGLAAGLLVATVHRLFAHYPVSGRLLPGLAAALSVVSVSGVPVYILGRVLLPIG